jgi:hypothetical protein
MPPITIKYYIQPPLQATCREKAIPKLKETIKKPIGLGVIQFVSVIFTLVFGIAFSTYLALASFYNLGFPSWLWVFLTLSGFTLAIFLSFGKPFVWYVANVYWIVLLVFYVYSGITFATAGYWYSSSYILYCPPLAYSIGCILYFQTGRVRQYFHVIRQ